MTPSSEQDRFLREHDPVHEEGTRIPDVAVHTLSYQKPSTDNPVESLFKSRRDIVAFGLATMSIYSTFMSGLFLVISVIRPQYGHVISKNGPFSPSAAALLTAFLAKTIEISFVTVFLAFLGQVLSRRAALQEGLDLASVAMRSWILQPGTLLTQWKIVRCAGVSLLGVLSLYAAVLTLLYTTASGALVQPLLGLPSWQDKSFIGSVNTQSPNIWNYRKICTTEWPILDDPTAGGSTCLQIKYKSQCYHNFNRYMSSWAGLSSKNQSESNLDERVPIFATLDDDIRVTTAWLHLNDIQTDSEKAGRIVNNVTIAVPHRGVPIAARDSSNALLQPEDLENAGSYSIDASVPSPFINSFCVNANAEELAPLIYETWSDVPITLEDYYKYSPPANETVLDDLFGWKTAETTGERGERLVHARPTFPRYPELANTIVNSTSPYWGKPEVYVLGRHPAKDNTDYFICSLKAGITTACSTRYNASSAGLTLEALCEGDATDMAYDKKHPEHFTKELSATPDWRDIGYNILNSFSLNTGIGDGNSSTARVLTQLQLRQPQFNVLLPSPAEALLSMVLCTTLDLAKGVPFVPFYNYSTGTPSLDDPQRQYFNVSVQVAQYMSGGTFSYQRGFIVVLASVFIINVFIFLYLIVKLRIRLITDICEPPVLFLLGYHSLPGNLFKGEVNVGPHRKDLSVPWIVKARYGQLVVTGIEEADIDVGSEQGAGRKIRQKPWGRVLGRFRKTET